MTKQQILDQAFQLSREDQLELAHALWKKEDEFPPVSPELAAELDRRIAEDDADPAPAENWDVLREKLLRGEI